jgi:hypothetical protein
MGHDLPFQFKSQIMAHLSSQTHYFLYSYHSSLKTKKITLSLIGLLFDFPSVRLLLERKLGLIFEERHLLRVEEFFIFKK